MYVGGHYSKKRDSARIYIYSPSADTWSVKDAPVYSFVLIGYKSKLLLVGGKEYVSERSDRRFDSRIYSALVLKEKMGQFEEFLPQMTRIKYEGLSAASHENYLLVADGKLGDVDVYDGNQWAYAQQIPREMTHRNMKSAIIEGRWYLTGGEGQERRVYYALIESLIASCQLDDISLPSSVWKSLDLPDAPIMQSRLIRFGKRLVGVGRKHLGLAHSSSIYVYSSGRHLWTDVYDHKSYIYSPAIVILSSGELMVIGNTSVRKATLKSMLSYMLHK